MVRFWLPILLAAIVIGGGLRFGGLAKNELSDDEAASWLAASAPTAAEVVAVQAQLNPGKMAIHELALHEWIGLFGASVQAMRALSAFFGTISILLVFMVARELFDSPPAGFAPGERDGIASMAAMVFAVNLVTIKYSHEARMYAMMLAVVLAQVGCFARATRRGTWLAIIGAAALMDMAVAVNFVAAAIPAVEGLWLLWILWRDRASIDRGETRRASKILGAMAAATALFVPIAMTTIRSSMAAASGHVWQWIEPPPIWEPLALFNKATGSIAFPFLAAMAAIGAVRGWPLARDGLGFALAWMWVPPILALVASYAIQPMFVERFLLPCFAPFFILTALGIWLAGSDRIRAAALALAVALSLGHIHSYARKPHDTQWREAAALALGNVAAGDTIGTVPAYSIGAVRYYLPSDQRARAIRMAPGRYDAKIVLLRDHGVAPAIRTAIRAAYPVELAHLRGVIVLRRD